MTDDEITVDTFIKQPITVSRFLLSNEMAQDFANQRSLRSGRLMSMSPNTAL